MATASRYSWHAMSISARSMSCARPRSAESGPGPARPGAGEVTALELTLRPLRPLLADPAVTEVCINGPGRAFVEAGEGWRCEELPFADFDWCRRLAALIANVTRQRVDESAPLLSASLPS